MTAADLVAGARALIEPLTGHTPGEWEMSVTHPTNACANVRCDYTEIATLYGGEGDVPADDEPWGPQPIRDANARLTAAAPALRDTVAALADLADALTQRIAELEARPTSSKQQASVPRLSPGREFVLRYLDDKGPSSSWPICRSAMAEGVGYGMDWADKYLRWLRTSGLAARTGRRDSSGRSIHQITNAGRARLKADEDAE